MSDRDSGVNPWARDQQMLRSMNRDVDHEEFFTGLFPFDAVKFDRAGHTASPTITLKGYLWKLDYAKLPTSDPSVEGVLWRDGDTLKISAG